jgi:phytanoyl-CoA hydroxylase
MASERARNSETASPLDEAGNLRSDLWLDQVDAHARIDVRVAAGAVSSADATMLHKFVDDGYLAFHIDLDAEWCDAFDDDLSALLQERRADLAISPPGAGGPRSLADYEGVARQSGYRVPDLHGYSSRAMNLYLHSEIFRHIELIFDEPAIAFQSLYFEYGSKQGLHRDPMFVPTKPVAHLLASWIALEDITPDSGPLAYVPGSHRLPWFQFEEDSVLLRHSVPPGKRLECQQWTNRQLRERGLETQSFTCRRGDVFIWHSGLMHGGRPIENPKQTRKSFVVH